jgi:hypothetical protein
MFSILTCPETVELELVAKSPVDEASFEEEELRWSVEEAMFSVDSDSLTNINKI